MTLAERRLRVVLTDGERMADFAWLRHAGRQVVCGVPDKVGWHITYPADGRMHMTIGHDARRTRSFVPETAVPLDTFTGQRALLTLGMPLIELAVARLRTFKHRTQDAVAFLDLRAFRDEVMLWIELGLVEVGKTDQLQFDFGAEQVLIVRNAVPWVYIAAGSKEGVITH